MSELQKVFGYYRYPNVAVVRLNNSVRWC